MIKELPLWQSKNMNSIFILLIGEVLLLMWAYILTSRDIMAPSVFMCIMFTISTLFAVLNVNNWNYGDAGYNFNACLLILGGLFFFIMAETVYRIISLKYFVLINSYNNKKTSNNVTLNNISSIIDIRTWKILLIIFFNIVVCSLYFLSIKKVVGTQNSVFEVFSAHRRLGIAKLAGDDSQSVNFIIRQLTNVVTTTGYIAGYLFINNWIAKDKHKVRQIMLLLIIGLSAVPSMMSAGRTQILQFLSAFLVYYYILWNQKYFWKKNVSRKFIKIGIIAVFLGIPVFYYSLKLLGRKTGLGLFNYTSDYLGSSIFLFGKYVESPIERAYWGEESLHGVRKIINFLGLGEASYSYNLEFRSTGIANSNIYTFFRRPLHDFDVVGMFVFTSLVAIFFGWMYWKKIKKRHRTNNVNKWVLIYGYFFYWIFCSSMVQYSQSYISIGAAVKIFLLLGGYCFLADNKIKIRLSTRRRIPENFY